jgi:hypothetical protein
LHREIRWGNLKEVYGMEDLGVENNIKIDIKEIGWEGVDWIHLARERGQIDGFMKTIMSLLVS